MNLGGPGPEDVFTPDFAVGDGCAVRSLDIYTDTVVLLIPWLHVK